MTKLNKTEVRSLIKEVLKERWLRIFPDSDDEKQKYQLYDDIEKWENDMVDLNNIYKGPELEGPGITFKKGDVIHQTGSDILDLVMQWNELMSEDQNFPTKELLRINGRLSTNYYKDHPEDVLGNVAAQ